MKEGQVRNIAYVGNLSCFGYCEKIKFTSFILGSREKWGNNLVNQNFFIFRDKNGTKISEEALYYFNN